MAAWPWVGACLPGYECTKYRGQGRGACRVYDLRVRVVYIYTTVGGIYIYDGIYGYTGP